MRKAREGRGKGVERKTGAGIRHLFPFRREKFAECVGQKSDGGWVQAVTGCLILGKSNRRVRKSFNTGSHLPIRVIPCQLMPNSDFRLY